MAALRAPGGPPCRDTARAVLERSGRWGGAAEGACQAPARPTLQKPGELSCFSGSNDSLSSMHDKQLAVRNTHTSPSLPPTTHYRLQGPFSPISERLRVPASEGQGRRRGVDAKGARPPVLPTDEMHVALRSF